jgi:hypothetical protein
MSQQYFFQTGDEKKLLKKRFFRPGYAAILR